MAVVCVLGEREAYGGGAFQVELDEKLGPFLRDPKAGSSYLKGGFA